MKNLASHSLLTTQDIAAAFAELDILWEMPVTPERTLRMESILTQLRTALGTDAV
jgi:hypothetical protein